jgi:hypothetical protein
MISRRCQQPFCELVLAQHCHFAFTCKPDSHPALYQEIDLLSKVGGVSEVSQRRWNGQRHEIWRYRYAVRVPLRVDSQPLYVNWCEVTITNAATGELLYRNAWATDHALTESGLHDFVVAARTRWKSENENNNVLKNYGYHLDLRQLRPRPAVPGHGAHHAQPVGVPVSHHPRSM